jgi:hypothetical protein
MHRFSRSIVQLYRLPLRLLSVHHEPAAKTRKQEAHRRCVRRIYGALNPNLHVGVLSMYSLHHSRSSTLEPMPSQMPVTTLAAIDPRGGTPIPRLRLRVHAILIRPKAPAPD